MQKLKKIRMCWCSMRKYLGLQSLWYGLSYLFSAIVGYLYIRLLNRLYEQISEGNFGTKIWMVFLAVAGCILISDLMNGIVNMVAEKFATGLEKGFMETYLCTARKLEPEQFLQKEVLDVKENAKCAFEGIFYFYRGMISLLFNHIPYYLMVMIFLFRMDARIAAVMLFTALPAVFTWKMRRNLNYDVSKQVGEKRRSMDAFESYNTTLPALYETRFFKMQGKFRTRFLKSMNEYRKIQTKYYRKMFGYTLLADLMHLVGVGIILGFIVYMVRMKAMNGAQVATTLTVLLSIYDSISRAMKNCVAPIFDNAGKVFAVLDFLALGETAPKASGEEIPAFSTVSLKDVSYRYPDASNEALTHVDLTLRKGEVLAIVGENGSGKTTLSRLLGGLLPTTEGMLLADGEAVLDHNKEAYRKHVSAVFQDFQHYPLTLQENICFGESISEEEFRRMISDVQLTEKNADVVLSKEFGGEEYSGGQWQRVAIARGRFKESELFLFDEPTSAIDPLEEVRIMKLLLSLCKGKMAVLVTHRIGAASLADRVAVMKQGRMVECGTHEELLLKKGEYYRMYEAQKQWY